MNLGYIFLFSLYAAIASLPFILCYLEYRRPADPGPLYIDLDRVVSDRKEAIILRELVEPAVEIGLLAKNIEDLSPEVVLKQEPRFHPELGYFKLICGDTDIPSNSTINEFLIVIGNLKIGDECKILGGVYATGKVRVGSDCLIRFIVSESDVFLGRNTKVEDWVDARGTIVVSEDCFVNKITCESKIKAVELCEIKEACAERGLEIVNSSGISEVGGSWDKNDIN